MSFFPVQQMFILQLKEDLSQVRKGIKQVKTKRIIEEMSLR